MLANGFDQSVLFEGDKALMSVINVQKCNLNFYLTCFFQCSTLYY